MSKIQLQNLASELDDILEEYGRNIKMAIDEQTEQSGIELRDRAKEIARTKITRHRKRNEYIRTIKINNVDRIAGNSAVLSGGNRNTGLVHLLEKGHILANSGRRTRAFPHFGPAFDEISPKYIKALEEIKRKGGK
jgi:Bacteriophage protein of unknown function (DUF646).